MANLKGKVETEIEIKASPEKFYNMFTKTAHHVPNAAGNHIKGVEVHEGDWDTHGSVKFWNYTLGKSTNLIINALVINLEYFINYVSI